MPAAAISGHCEDAAHRFCFPSIDATTRCVCTCHPSLEAELIQRLTEAAKCLVDALTTTPFPDIDQINDFTKDARRLAIALTKATGRSQPRAPR
mgnify:CR=1 FL=1